MSGKPVCLASFMAMNPKKAARIIADHAPVRFCTIGWSTPKYAQTASPNPVNKTRPKKVFPEGVRLFTV
ncbi:hypothetical protein MSSAC_0681 [Methanosarcina siciliae C2J]|uniref:Uncharacterized protein n=1 Tax=Methanosarcina siciliae C2J TaxID=1434118 RepID=A0A0E3LCC3_9EURY|nr:hypothetical protein MSSAC_0681 [Methanosarcina siciliae C2J]